MIILGVTGGIGSGKSVVLDYLQSSKGAVICLADETGRQIQRKGGEAYGPIVRLFGEEILLENGELDRPAISRIVFHDPGRLEELNAIVHPLVERRVLEESRRAEAEGRDLFVVESAILLEVGYQRFCEEVWYVHAPEEVRLARLQKYRGMAPEAARAVMERQKSEEELKKACDVTIENGAGLEELYEQIDRHCQRLMENGTVQHSEREQR